MNGQFLVIKQLLNNYYDDLMESNNEFKAKNQFNVCVLDFFFLANCHFDSCSFTLFVE